MCSDFRFSIVHYLLSNQSSTYKKQRDIFIFQHVMLEQIIFDQSTVSEDEYGTPSK